MFSEHCSHAGQLGFHHLHSLTIGFRTSTWAQKSWPFVWLIKNNSKVICNDFVFISWLDFTWNRERKQDQSTFVPFDCKIYSLKYILHKNHNILIFGPLIKQQSFVPHSFSFKEWHQNVVLLPRYLFWLFPRHLWIAHTHTNYGDSFQLTIHGDHRYIVDGWAFRLTQ